MPSRQEQAAKKQAIEWAKKQFAKYRKAGMSVADAQNSVLCDAGRINIFTQRTIEKGLGYKFIAESCLRVDSKGHDCIDRDDEFPCAYCRRDI